MPKHREISETLQREIAQHKFDPADRLPSENELVRRFKVSRPTVARALRDLQSLNLIERRAGSGTYLRQSAPTIQKPLGLIAAGLGNTEIIDPICAEIARLAESQNFTLLQGGSYAQDFSAQHAEALCRQYITQKVAGVFFAPLELPPATGLDPAALNTRIAHALAAVQIPVILLDRDLAPFPARSHFDLISIDNFAAALTLADHLLAQGARRLAFLAKPNYPATTDLRIAGAREALARRPDLHPAALRIRIGNPTDLSFVQKLLKEKPDAILCSNDLTAAQLAQTLTQLRIRIPHDLRLAAFDDIKYATLLNPPLTTMRQPCRELAQAAMHALQSRLTNPTLPPRQILLTAELIIRQSSTATE